MRPERIDEVCRAIQPIIGKQKAEALRKLYYSEDEPKLRAEALALAETVYAFRAKTSAQKMSVLPPPEPSACSGDIPIGTITYLNTDYGEFSLNLRDVNRHVGLFGSTRSGKTTLATRMILGLRNKNIKVLILDWEQNYRGLAAECPDFLVFTVGPGTAPFYHNPLALPPGVPSEEFCKSLVSVISHDYLGGYGSDTIMLQKLVECYRQKGEPTFSDLARIIDEEITEARKTSGQSEGRRGLWKQTVERIPEWLGVGYTADVLFTQKHLPISVLLDVNAVLELGGLVNKADRAFICHLILNQLFFYKKAAGITHERLTSVIVAEEAHQLFGIDRAGAGETTLSLISDLYRMIGKYGVGIIAIDQTPSLIPNEVFANMNTKVGFVQNTKNDTLALARAMNLDEDSFDYLGRLNTGQAIVSVKQRVHDAFLINTYYKEPLPNILDHELSGLMQRSSGLSVTISQDETIPLGSHGSQPKECVPPLEKVSVHEKALLRDISRNPFDGVDIRTKRLRWHQADMTQAHTGLTEKGYVEPVNVIGKKLFGLTQKGRDVSASLGIEPQSLPGRGGVAHSYGIHVVTKRLKELGFNPVIEYENIDVCDPDAGIAVEVETGKSDVYSNLKKLVSAKYKYRFVLGIDKSAETTIRQIVKPESGIKVMSVREFSKQTKNDVLSGTDQRTLS